MTLKTFYAVQTLSVTIKFAKQNIDTLLLLELKPIKLESNYCRASSAFDS